MNAQANTPAPATTAKPKRAKKAKQAEAPVVVKRTMSETLRAYRPRYAPTVAASGNKSLNNGDEIAQLLKERTAEDVERIAERALKLKAGELTARYAKLNIGQRRMNSGNRIRNAYKAGDLSMKDLKAAIVS